MRTRYKLPLLATGLAVAAIFSVTLQAAEVTIRAQTALPAKHDLTKSFLELFVAPLNATGKGVVQIRYIGGPEVTPVDKAAPALQRGVIDMLHSPAAYHAGITPQSQALMATNMTPTEVRANGGFDIIQKAWKEKLNARILAWSETEAQFYLYTTREPVVKDGRLDMTGFKMRATGAYRPLLNALGATAVQMPAGEVYTGLQRGLVDGFGWPTVGLGAMGLAEVTKYRIEPAFYHLANLVLVNHDFWDKLPADAQQILADTAATYEAAAIRDMQDAALADTETVKKQGVKIFELTGEARKNYLKAAYDSMWDRVAEKLGAEETAVLRAKLYREE
jgi:TRAP-type transport system periplasmic protein